MNDEQAEIDALVEAIAPLIGLCVTEAQRPGVVLHFGNTYRIASRVLRFPLPERAENAPVFRP